MNALDILKYGHGTVCRAIEEVPATDWEIGGVCGEWSVKDIIGHLAAFELLLVDILSSLTGSADTPYLQQVLDHGFSGFNDIQAAQRKNKTRQEVLDEYNAAYERVMVLAAPIPADTWRANGALPWYGAEYSLDDFIVYTYYGHKREHSAQIDHFRSRYH